MLWLLSLIHHPNHSKTIIFSNTLDLGCLGSKLRDFRSCINTVRLNSYGGFKIPNEQPNVNVPYPTCTIFCKD
ncbi:hypothetical protein BC938DRAFT_474702 [Jimgerdemannia flammicorona]|uniref:Uncharacterized protein n=1 Tax=Jimgerdemannia flammicorona TaxID=994334 RepID=A0A433QSD0_9FUNG|nr:hypothetical protein BC938DRAFT_474702 [Jimgerdemannia flammicorona]